MLVSELQLQLSISISTFDVDLGVPMLAKYGNLLIRAHVRHHRVYPISPLPPIRLVQYIVCRLNAKVAVQYVCYNKISYCTRWQDVANNLKYYGSLAA